MEELILKYLQNEISKEEELQLSSWLEQEETNRIIFENMVGDWQLSQKEINLSKRNTLADIKKLKSLPTQQISQKTDRHIAIGTWGAVAAIVLLAICLGVVLNLGEDSGEMQVLQERIIIEKQTERGQKLTFELPDGTQVKLNSDSRLIYPEQFDKDNRTITLEGEAFFDVARNEEKPFKVVTDDRVLIEVLGTSFNVNSHHSNSVIVAVKHGKVQVTKVDSKEKILLNDHQITVVKESSKKLSKHKISEQEYVFGWLHQEITFNNRDLNFILEKLSRWYDVDFVFERQVNSNKRLTGKWSNPTLVQVMESLGYTYDFEFEKKGKTIIIR